MYRLIIIYKSTLLQILKTSSQKCGKIEHNDGQRNNILDEEIQIEYRKLAEGCN